MKKKIIFGSIIGIFIIVLIVVWIVIFKNKPNLNYEIDIVDEIDYMVYSENNKFGVIDKKGATIVQALYDEVQIPNPSKPLFICMYGYNTEKDQYNIKVFNEKSEQILYQYVFVEAIKINPALNPIPYEKSVLKYKKDGKYGLIDFEGNVIVDAQYEKILGLDYKEGLLVVQKDGKYGVININGAVIIKTMYDSIESDGYYEDGVNYEKAGFIVGKKMGDSFVYGYINYNGKQILDTQYSQIDRIMNINKNEDVYLVAFKNEKAGLYINENNIIEHKYEDIVYDSNNNCLIIQENSKQGISDINGKIQIDIQYDNIYVSGKYVNAHKNGQVDIYDYQTKQKITYEKIVGLNQTINEKYSIAITNDDKYKILDDESGELKENEYDYLSYAYDNYFIASKNQKYGIIDVDGNELVEFKYDFIQKVGNTKILQAVHENNESIDLIVNGEVISSMENSEVYMENNYIVQRSNSDVSYIGLDGKILKNTDVLEKKLYAYKQDEKWGFVDENGEMIVNPEYDFVTEFNEYGFAGVKKEEKWGVINLDRDIIVEPQYDIDSSNPKFVGKYYELNLGYGEPYYICDNVNN